MQNCLPLPQFYHIQIGTLVKKILAIKILGVDNMLMTDCRLHVQNVGLLSF
jgi:hypothetical protein